MTLPLRVLIAITILLLVSGPARADFALRDGDVVVFLGDSITEAGGYARIVEDYTLLSHPRRHVRFYNEGVGGNTAPDGLARLRRDVFDRGATVLIVAFGINDIGWGAQADAQHKQRFLDAMAQIVTQARSRGVRVFVCSPAITSEAPDRAEKGFLQQMSDELLRMARDAGAETIDVQREMRAVQRRVAAANAAEKDPSRRASLHQSDGVHPTDLGQMAIALAVLKGLHATPNVSSLDLDGTRVVRADGCTVSDLREHDGVLSFTRLDEALPLNFGIFGWLQFRFVPYHDDVARYMLRIRSLPPGRYAVTVDGRPLGTWDAQQLQAAVNIGAATGDGWQAGGPWDVQATILRKTTEARGLILNAARYAQRALPLDPPRSQIVSDGEKLLPTLESLQRETAAPRPYRFEVRRAP